MPDLHTFEMVFDGPDAVLDRVAVPGGWLYRTRTTTSATALAYVPDGPTQGGAALGSCFWYANLAEVNLSGDGDWNTLGIVAEDAYGETGLISAADDGFVVNGNCVVALDLWVELAAPAASGAQIGFEIDKGTLLTRGQVQLMPGVQTIQRTSYQGLLQTGHEVRSSAMFAVGDAVSVLGTSYITAHIMPA
jgi:hypothetical protein